MLKPEMMAALTGTLRLAKDVDFWEEEETVERLVDVASCDDGDVGVE